MLLVYLVKNFIVDILLFFKHWYIDGLVFIYGKMLGIVRRLERGLAIRLNLRFIFKPLYQERNIYGYVLGFIFRAFRVITGAVLYLVIVLAAVAVYILWAAIPTYSIYKIFKNI